MSKILTKRKAQKPFANREINLETLKKDYEKFKIRFKKSEVYPNSNGLKVFGIFVCGVDVRYICGMSVPPFMIQRIAEEIKRQWFLNVL